MYYVYRFINSDNKIIYVGMATDRESQSQQTTGVIERMKEHFSSSGHLPSSAYRSVMAVQYVTFPTRTDAEIVEKYLINLWKPLYNKKNKEYTSLSVDVKVELKWKLLRESLYKKTLPERTEKESKLIEQKRIIDEQSNQIRLLNEEVRKLEDLVESFKEKEREAQREEELRRETFHRSHINSMTKTHRFEEPVTISTRSFPDFYESRDNVDVYFTVKGVYEKESEEDTYIVYYGKENKSPRLHMKGASTDLSLSYFRRNIEIVG